MNNAKNPIYEGILLKCAECNIDLKYVPTIYELALRKNPIIKKAHELITKGELNV